MSLKREVSKSIADLQVTVKRLALDELQSSQLSPGEESPPPSQAQFEINSAITASAEQEGGGGDDNINDYTSNMQTINANVMHVAENENAYSNDSSILKSVLSTSRNDFNECYVKLEEIGRGGFSVVYKCRHVLNDAIFAVKIIDLRPLKLHERFNPSRLRREVDIMRRLRHPNIIQFVEVFENDDQLLVVMEYAPGDELFDVILARQFFTEQDAKPIFQQICSSLAYLHSLDIIHRDIKPENILFMHQRHPVTQLPMVKLLDFGLSKHAGMGSEAKTFVGTPCYLAPEVEFTAKGQGGTYGAPADCWSMGAVLYVMLVARFPEFHKHENGRIELKLPGPLWDNKSAEARALVKGLMCYDPNKRLTALQALSHPWLGAFAISPSNSNVPPPLPPAGGDGRRTVNHNFSTPNSYQRRHNTGETSFSSSSASSNSSYSPAPSAYSNTSTPSSTQPKGKGARSNSNDVLDMVLHPHYNANIQDQLSASSSTKHHYSSPDISIKIPPHQTPPSLSTYDGINYALTTNNGNGNNHVSSLNLSPLLALQRNIANCFEAVHSTYYKHPTLSTQVRDAAVVCRAQVGESTKMLRKIEQTSLSVLDMFPDLELALEENEPALAGVFFDMVKTWVGELIKSVNTTQQANRASITKIQNILEVSTHNFKVSSSPRISNGDIVTVSITDLQRTLKDLQEKQNSNTLNDTDFVALFSSLFDQQKQTPPVAASRNTQSPRSEANSGYSSDEDFIIGGNSVYGNSGRDNRDPVCEEVGEEDEMDLGQPQPFSLEQHRDGDMNDMDDCNALALVSKQHDRSALTSSALSGQEQLEKALDILQQVDTILEQLSMFWGNTEVVLDMLSKKGQHAEQFIGFSHNPKLHQRFKERVSEYKRFWEGVLSMCSTYLMGIVEPQDTLSRFCTPPEEVSFSSATSTASSLSSESSASTSTPPPGAEGGRGQRCTMSTAPTTSTFLNANSNSKFAPSSSSGSNVFTTSQQFSTEDPF